MTTRTLSSQYFTAFRGATVIDVNTIIAPGAPDVFENTVPHDWTPIPLTAFESMMLLDDRPGFSMSCAAELHFDGAIQREIFETAFDRAISRHKLLCAIVVGDGRKQRWIPAPTKPVVFWNHENAREEFAQMRNFDLTRESGVRTWVNVSGDRSVLRFDFHHACCDAAGGMASIDDLFTIYDALKNSRLPDLRPLDDSRLMARSHIELGSPSILARLSRSLVDITKSLRLLFTKPLPIPISGDAGLPWTDRFVRRRLSEADLVGLRYAASDVDVTLNDLMLLEFMCALRDWTQRGKSDASVRDHIRIVAPMNLRDRADIALSAANKIGFGFVSRSLDALKGASTGHWRETVQDLNSEMKKARSARLPAQFLKKLAIARVSRRWFASFFTDKRCWATGILTQLGDPTRRFHTRFARREGRILVGDLRLTEIVSCAPLRPLTRALLSVNTYGNEMTLTMRCDPATIGQREAEEFLDDFVHRLLQRKASRTRDGH